MVVAYSKISCLLATSIVWRFIDHDANHKRCMECGEIMPADEYCECLKRAGREIRRKAIEQYSKGSKRGKSKRSTNNGARGSSKPPVLF